MSLSPEQIQQVARLARLNITEEQTQGYARQLSNIFEMVEQLSATNTDDVVPMAHPLGMEQRLREDEVTEPNQRETFQKIAPSVENGLYRVPKVIE